MSENENIEWVSPSSLARRLGVSCQTIYNRIARGQYVAKAFRRGKYKGWLIRWNNVNHDDNGGIKL